LLWGGQFISSVGGQLTGLAVPAAVVVLLGATPMETGALQAVGCGVIPLLAMFAGVVVDRYSRRRAILWASAIRGAALFSLPLAFVLHGLTLAQFFIVSFVCGLVAIVYDTAFVGLFAVVVPRERFAAGNATVAVASSGAEALGTSIAGMVVAALGAPFAIACDAVCNVIAIGALARMRCAEPPIAARGANAQILALELVTGIRALTRDRALRAIGLANAVSHFGGAIVMAVFAIYVYRVLHFSPLLLGVVMGFANIGILGAFFAERIARRIGMRRTLMLALAIGGAANLLLPICAPLSPLAALVAMRLLQTLCGPIFEVNAQTLRVARVAPELLGRMTATNRTLVWGALPLGALCGGLLGSTIGIGTTLIVGGAIALGAAAMLAACPVLPPAAAGSASPLRQSERRDQSRDLRDRVHRGCSRSLLRDERAGRRAPDHRRPRRTRPSLACDPRRAARRRRRRNASLSKMETG
jgi:MFS family permease